MKKFIWYKRSGERVSEAAVKRAKASYVQAKRTGEMGLLKCSVQPEVADAIERMPLREWANYSGMFTYKFPSNQKD